MKAMFLAAAVLMCLAAEAARLESQMTASRSAVEMTGVKPVLKMQCGRLLDAAKWQTGPARQRGRHRARRLDQRPLSLWAGASGCSRGNNPDLRGHQEEQVVRAGEYFCEPCDMDITVFNRSKKPAKLLIVEWSWRP